MWFFFTYTVPHITEPNTERENRATLSAAHVKSKRQMFTRWQQRQTHLKEKENHNLTSN